MPNALDVSWCDNEKAIEPRQGFCFIICKMVVLNLPLSLALRIEGDVCKAPG